MPYIGNAPRTANFLIDQFSGDNTEVNFTLSLAPGSLISILVFISGVRQSISDYSLNGAVLTFSSPPATGSNNIEVVHIAHDSGTVPSDLSVSTAKLQDSSVTDSKLSTTTVCVPPVALVAAFEDGPATVTVDKPTGNSKSFGLKLYEVKLDFPIHYSPPIMLPLNQTH